jgi:hypothetical protein
MGVMWIVERDVLLMKNLKIAMQLSVKNISSRYTHRLRAGFRFSRSSNRAAGNKG